MSMIHTPPHFSSLAGGQADVHASRAPARFLDNTLGERERYGRSDAQVVVLLEAGSQAGVEFGDVPLHPDCSNGP